ncbi:M23 family metallopeptidase [Parvularcula maris]|uniref:M23 family metallopeptidase n=1 Tax=Parvularcula maris TaxID=2965077 RepID=A0A9X2RIC3_9PROT|nr:M23 family metallopeptidase [Parvularcula maris]MCQ8185834.1 M23 family metallopeptidase [Parvularcula maris]
MKRAMNHVRLLGAVLLMVAAAGCASAPKGSYTSPVDGTVTSNFGKRKRNYHTGIDIAAPKGTEVRAAKSGKVAFRGRNKKYGRLLIIDHGDGTETYYAHLAGYNIRKGKKVKAGQKIGRVGRSGRATGYHLHFELRVSGRPVDPRGVVPL